jgi:hypothetical protein
MRWTPEMLVALGGLVVAVLGAIGSFLVTWRRVFPGRERQLRRRVRKLERRIAQMEHRGLEDEG